MECPRYVGNSLSVEGKGYRKPRAPQKRYVKTLNLNASGKPGFGDPSGGSDGQNDCEMDGEDVTTKSYTWDVDRINRLAQPRQRVREDLSPPLQITKEYKVVRSRKPRLLNTTGKRHHANSPKHQQVSGSSYT